VPLAAVENALVLDGSSYACMQVHGMSIRQAAREFGLPRKRPVQRPKLGPWLGIIDRILVDDQSQPKKQRHTVERIRA
jgi:hypothetical protein